MSTSTGQMKEARCQSYGCHFCGPRLALATALAIEYSRPNWSGVVTLRGRRWRTPSGDEAFRDFHRRILATIAGVREWADFELAWVVEVSLEGVPHVHLLARSEGLLRGQFVRAASAAGFPYASIQRIRRVPPLARYLLKHAIGALDLPPREARVAMVRHLELNGWRLLHWTRGFWLDPAGNPLPGVRVARIAALRHRQPGDHPRFDRFSGRHPRGGGGPGAAPPRGESTS